MAATCCSSRAFQVPGSCCTCREPRKILVEWEPRGLLDALDPMRALGRTVTRMRAPTWEQDYCDFFEVRRRPLMRTAYAILGSWVAAEDATQQTFVQLYMHWPRIRSGAVDSYARRTLVNACYASLRKGRREVLADAVPEHGSADPVPGSEQRLDLAAALQQLS